MIAHKATNWLILTATAIILFWFLCSYRDDTETFYRYLPPVAVLLFVDGVLAVTTTIHESACSTSCETRE